jgi:hypothetical protein
VEPREQHVAATLWRHFFLLCEIFATQSDASAYREFPVRTAATHSDTFFAARRSMPNARRIAGYFGRNS